MKLTLVIHTSPISRLWKAFDAGINQKEIQGGCLSGQGCFVVLATMCSEHLISMNEVWKLWKGNIEIFHQQLPNIKTITALIPISPVHMLGEKHHFNENIRVILVSIVCDVFVLHRIAFAHQVTYPTYETTTFILTVCIYPFFCF